MKRTQPTEHIDVIGPLCMPSLQAVGPIRESKETIKQCIKPPNNNGMINDIEFLGIHADREHKAMIEQQKLLQKYQQKKTVVDASKIDEMYYNFTKLRDDFIKMNGYFKEMDDKKCRAREVIAGQTKLHRVLRTENNELRKNIEEITKFRDILKGLVKQFEPYEVVINEAVERYKIAKSVGELINRCDALMLTQDEIYSRRKETLNDIVVVREKMNKKVNEALNTIMAMHTLLNESVRGLTEASYQCSKWEQTMKDCKSALVERQLEDSLITFGIRDAYHTLCRFNRTTPALRTMEEQIAFIRTEIHVYKDILEECGVEFSENTDVKENKEDTTGKTQEETPEETPENLYQEENE